MLTSIRDSRDGAIKLGYKVQQDRYSPDITILLQPGGVA